LESRIGEWIYVEGAKVRACQSDRRWLFFYHIEMHSAEDMTKLREIINEMWNDHGALNLITQE
jgi:hypothetical protein